ncbi:hypothetical protein BDY19DRAFT_270242 [Irpex rosettiformis]|uniref:Uncharacterized protein n=1 Tax=Irpex rosettiformis TaxID=378272 RepID=A0ACB8UH91_9APHY|nr:hypothetical protein BDY19DRAFT_270242 [Irpex rosettiformis]
MTGTGAPVILIKRSQTSLLLNALKAATVDCELNNTQLVFVACSSPLKLSLNGIPTFKQNDQPMPTHWNSEFPKAWFWPRPILKLLFTTLVLVSFGHSSLQQKWEIIQSNKEKFTECMDRVSARISTITVVAGLLLSCVVALITTPPPETTILDYNQRGPYLCLWVAFGILLGGIIVGSTDIHVLFTCSPRWMQQTLMATRMRLLFALIFFAYPFFAIGCATLVCVFGLLVACWLSDDRIVQVACVFLLLAPASLVLPFVLTQLDSSVISAFAAI